MESRHLSGVHVGLEVPLDASWTHGGCTLGVLSTWWCQGRWDCSQVMGRPRQQETPLPHSRKLERPTMLLVAQEDAKHKQELQGYKLWVLSATGHTWAQAWGVLLAGEWGQQWLRAGDRDGSGDGDGSWQRVCRGRAGMECWVLALATPGLSTCAAMAQGDTQGAQPPPPGQCMAGQELAQGGRCRGQRLLPGRLAHAALQDLLSGTRSQLLGTPGCLGKQRPPACLQPYKEFVLHGCTAPASSKHRRHPAGTQRRAGSPAGSRGGARQGGTRGPRGTQVSEAVGGWQRAWAGLRALRS